MPRCPAEERELLTALVETLRDFPDAMMVAGAIDLGPESEGCTLAVGFVDADPIGLAALADSSLELAARKMIEGGHHARFPDLWRWIEQARHALKFGAAETAS